MCKQTCNTQKKLKSMEKFIKELGEGYWEAYLDNEKQYLDLADDYDFTDKKLSTVNLKMKDHVSGEEGNPLLEKYEITLKKKQSRGELLLEGLGGKDNILVVDNCYTRLRVNVEHRHLVSTDLLSRINGVKRVIRLYDDKCIHIVVGQGVEAWRDELLSEGVW